MAVHIKDKKISIGNLLAVLDPDGFQTGTEWTPIPGGDNIWAYYRQSSGSEFFAAAAVQAKIDAVFEINWRDDLTTDMLVEFRGKRYDITRIDDFEGYKNTLTISASLQE